MSTKTSIKRIAAVAAVALTLGGFSAVSAHAAAQTLKVGQDAGSGDGGSGAIAGPANSVIVNILPKAADSAASYSEFVTVSGAGATIIGAVNQAALTNTETSTVYASGTSIGAANIASTGLSAVFPGASGTDRYIDSLKIATPTAGTITVSVYNGAAAGVSPSSYNAAADATYTITVGASGTSGVLSATNSKAYINSKTYIDAGTNLYASDSTIVASGLTANTFVGEIRVQLKDASANGGAAIISGKTVTASVAGAGLIKGSTTAIATSDTGAGSARVATATSDTTAGQGYAFFAVYSDGTAGTSTITISQGTTTLATKTLIFSGKVAKLVAVQNHYIVNTDASTALGSSTAGDGAVTITATDANGNPVVGASIKTTSSDTSILASAAAGTNVTDQLDGTYDVTIVGASTTSGKSATETFVALDSDGTTVLASTAAVSFTTGADQIATFTTASDSDSYSPGTKATLTITAKDKYGNLVADGKYGLFAAVGSASKGLIPSISTTTTPFAYDAGAGVGTKFINGVATATVYTPFLDGNVTFAGTTTGASVSHYGVNSTLANSTSGTAVSVTVAVATASSSAAQAAIDAAQEATDAANAAYDAANNAMDSADAATAAAQDASDNASAALAAVTSLSATVAKLVKSVAAIAAALAKVQKKIGA